jgi:hypothetical protein
MIRINHNFADREAVDYKQTPSSFRLIEVLSAKNLCFESEKGLFGSNRGSSLPLILHPGARKN